MEDADRGRRLDGAGQRREVVGISTGGQVLELDGDGRGPLLATGL